MDEQTREALTNRAAWLKGAVLLLFYLLLLVATPVLIVISLVGWIGLLIKGQVPSGVRDFGRELACWFEQTARYLTGNASRRPFPFEDLDCPSDEPGEQGAQMPTGNQQPAGSEAKADADNGRSTPAAEKKESGKKESGKKKTGKKRATKKKTSKKKSAKKKSAKKKSGKKKSTAGKKKTSKTAVMAPPSEPPPSPEEGSDGGRNE